MLSKEWWAEHWKPVGIAILAGVAADLLIRVLIFAPEGVLTFATVTADIYANMVVGAFFESANSSSTYFFLSIILFISLIGFDQHRHFEDSIDARQMTRTHLMGVAGIAIGVILGLTFSAAQVKAGTIAENIAEIAPSDSLQTEIRADLARADTYQELQKVEAEIDRLKGSDTP